ncbi:TonB-dependent receptor plug domain-containing protein [Thalassotalea marina]|uniref:TonB-dependent receptor n=1 Tax=Thalassotalea marina TaxID=1673741 RepID=A0A919EI06_9GAMM|nr:TonB-dependent receptor [Thalassotalea marina]GHF85735.1 TonB-dependent receptor [Thalassotalea marina]
MNKTLVTMAVQSAIFSTAVAISGPVFAAQEQALSQVELQQTAENNTSEQAKSDKTEKITVTGSRLRRDSFSVATPMATLGVEAIEDTGLGSLSEILVQELPQIAEGVANTNSQSYVSVTGLSTIDLRDLGSNRTLTLIDGRRTVSNSYSGNYVSLSTIPAGMVQKVEIITGGASATYGSDAIAGVVNIITQKDKEGFAFKGRYGDSHEGGGEEISLDLDYGTEFADSRGYLFFSASFDEQKGLDYWDRKRAQQEDVFRYNAELMCNQMLTENDYQCMRDITKADWRNRSDGLPGGVFGETSRNDTQFWYDGQTLRNDWKDNEEKYGIHANQYEWLKVPDEALSAALKLDFEVTDDVLAYYQIQYSENKSVNVKSPEDDYEGAAALVIDPVTGAPSRVAPGYIPMDNPFVPEEIRNAGLYRDRIYWDRRFSEVGPVTTDNKRTTLRTWGGLQGTVFNGEWDWDISASYGRTTQDQTRLNELNTLRVREALQAERLDDGTIQCKSEAARAEGCVPLNLFGEGSITPEMANYIRANPVIDSTVEQFNIVGYVAGDLFELPAGAVGAVFGAEYRKDKQDLRVSDDQQYGGITFNIVPEFSGDVNVTEIFGELAIPVLKDQEFAKELNVTVASRFADYSWSDSNIVGSHNLAVVWEIADGYMFRGSYARAQRAPSIAELLSPPRGDYDSFDDICDGLTATSTNVGHDSCRQDPVLAQLLAQDPNFEFEDRNTGYSPNTGNGELKEETADTYTFGLSLSPEIFQGVQVAVDYYDITVSDAIAQIDNNDIIRQCYASDTPFGASNNFCNDITRDAEGNIIEILQRSFNVDELTTRGYDIAAAYKYDLGDMGSLKFKADITHVIEYSKTFETNDGKQTNNYLGDMANGIFKDKASASVTWTYDDAWRVRWSAKWKDSMIHSLEDQKDYYAPLDENGDGGIFTKNDANCAAGLESCVENPEAPKFYNIPSYIRHDLSVSYKMDLENEGTLRLYGGVNNIFDNVGPFMRGYTGNYASAFGRGMGRYFFAGAEVKF